MTSTPSPAAVRAWTLLLQAHKVTLSDVEGQLKAAGLPPLAWYDVLLELDRAGARGLRPFELERVLLLPQYGLSRLVDRIAAAGHLERRPCPADRRGQILVITGSGKDLRRRMWPVYGAAIEAALGAHLTETEATDLAALLGKLT